MPHLITTLGTYERDQIGMILPHEHVFVDLRKDNPPDFAQAEPQAVAALMGPELERARDAGVSALVECTPEGVGRRADLVRAASEAAGVPVVVASGIYREPWVPQWALDASEDELYDWMAGELNEEIKGCGVRAAWIKLSTGDDGITPVEAKILRAATRAARETNAAIGSHTIRGRVVRDQLAIIEAEGYTAERFIWIHAQAEEDFALNVEMARRGVFIEYDWIGGSHFDDAYYIDRIQRMIEAGLADSILISHDRGWYDPGQPNGGTPQPFTYISETFIPGMRAAGISDDIIHQITVTNPFRAFAR